ncbi:MAG: BamA/TamA family outer membrane protein [Bernardetiaceae bacterium]|nr:BamA/TamA family outer membrane protein [Bernardetiaceae bacterium]
MPSNTNFIYYFSFICFCILCLPIALSAQEDKGTWKPLKQSQDKKEDKIIAVKKRKEHVHHRPDSIASYLKRDSIKVVSVQLEGNRITKDYIVRRELIVDKPFFMLHRDKLHETLEWEAHKIFNTQLFTHVDAYYKEIEANEFEVIFVLKERFYLFPLPIMEPADRNLNEWVRNHNLDFRRIHYGFNLRHQNMRGRKENLRMRLQLGFTQRFDLSYAVPYINRKRTLGLEVSASYAQNKTINYKTLRDSLIFLRSDEVLLSRFNTGVGLHYRGQFFDQHYWNVAYNDRNIADTIAYLNEDYFGRGQTRQRFFSLGYSYAYRKHDNNNYPLKGNELRLQVRKDGLGIYDDINMLTVNTFFSNFAPLSKRFYASNALITKMSFAEEQPYFNLQGIGYGRDVIRGFELNVIESQHHFISKNTLAFKAIDTDVQLKSPWGVIPKQFTKMPIAVFPKVYLDMGYAQNNNSLVDNRLANTWLVGVGAGVDIVTYYDVVIRLEYTANNHGMHGFYFDMRSSF